MATIVRPYHLVTADIIYHRPDHLWLLQEYVWQDFDLPPYFPELKHFLQFWQRELEGPLHSVIVASVDLTDCSEIRFGNFLKTLQ